MAVFWVKNKVASPIVPPLATSTPTGGIEFSFDKIKVGQKIGDFTVLSVGPKNGGMPYDEFNVQVDFDGDVKLSGTYDVRYYEMPGSYIWSFYPDKESASRMPIFHGDNVWNIGLSGQDPTNKLFTNNTKGTIILEVSNLSLIHYPSTGSNIITIKKIIDKTEEPI